MLARQQRDGDVAWRVHALGTVEVAELHAGVEDLGDLRADFVLQVRGLVDVAARGAVLGDVERSASCPRLVRGRGGPGESAFDAREAVRGLGRIVLVREEFASEAEDPRHGGQGEEASAACEGDL